VSTLQLFNRWHYFFYLFFIVAVAVAVAAAAAAAASRDKYRLCCVLSCDSDCSSSRTDIIS
jgi:hypothetical protein